MKKFIALIFAFGLAAGAFAARETVNGVQYYYTVSGGEAKIGNGSSSAISKTTGGSLVVPSKLGGCPVTSIAAYAFNNCSYLTSVTIPDSVTNIKMYAFSGCSSLTSVTIGNGATTILDAAFADCSSLTTVSIGNSVSMIGVAAFSRCTSLESVKIPDSVKTIEDRAFDGCSSLTTVVIGNGVTAIKNQAFYNCTSLNSLTMGKSIKTIEANAFSGCHLLKSVALSDSITTIEVSAFDGCSALESIDIGASNNTYYSKDGVVYSKDGLKLFFCPRGKASVIIPEGVTMIGYSAFGYCKLLTSVSIPEGVTSIWSCAFKGCSLLTSVTIPKSVTTIGASAFEGCSSLKIVNVDKDDADRVKELMLEKGVDVEALTFVEMEVTEILVDDVNGTITLPEGMTEDKVSIKIMVEGHDIRPYINLPAAVDGVIDLSAAIVKEEVVKEALDPEKGAVIDFGQPGTSAPTITTAPTKPGLTYTLVEGTTLESMGAGASKLGDGTAWTPEIMVKGGNSGFYMIKVTK